MILSDKMSTEKRLQWRRVRFWRTNSVLWTPGRKRMSGKLSYGPEVGRPLNVTVGCDVLWPTLSDWEWTNSKQNVCIKSMAIDYSIRLRWWIKKPTLFCSPFLLVRNPNFLFDSPWCYVLEGRSYEAQPCNVPVCQGEHAMFSS